PKDHLPPGDPQGERALAEVHRDQAEDLLGGARDDRPHDHGERHGAGEGGEAPERHHHHGPDEGAGHDRGGRQEDLGDEPHDPGGPAVPVLGEVDPGEEPERDREQRGHPDDQPGSDEGLDDPAAGLARRDRLLREEVDVEGRDAFADNERRDEDEREHREEPAGPEEEGEGAVLRTASCAERPRRHGGRDGAHLATSCTAGRDPSAGGGPPETRPALRRTSNRENAAITRAIATRTTASARRAERCTPTFVASRNSLAMTAGIVKPGRKSDAPIPRPLPTTSETAIVSPSARPR